MNIHKFLIFFLLLLLFCSPLIEAQGFKQRVFEAGSWKLVVDFKGGGRSEGQNGYLYQKGKSVKGTAGQEIQTPLGKMKYYGDPILNSPTFMLTGWNFADSQMIRPSHETTQSLLKQVDTASFEAKAFQWIEITSKNISLSAYDSQNNKLHMGRQGWLKLVETITLGVDGISQKYKVLDPQNLTILMQE